MAANGTLTAGQLAKAAGVGTETIRFYERKGLLPKPARRTSGYREYTLGDAKRIQFIKRSQELGFTLTEIKGLLELRTHANGICAEVKQRTSEKLIEVSAKIRDLKKLEKALKYAVSTCAKPPRSTSKCSILDLIESGKVNFF